MSTKYRLVTPGPCMVPPDTLLELAREMRHHRTSENKALIADTISRLKRIFVTEQDVLLFASSGTGAMEACVSNVLKPGDKTIVLVGGKWGARWQQICDTFGMNTVVLKHEAGVAFSPQEVEHALEEHPDAKAVFTQLSETSSGVGHDIEQIGKLFVDRDALFVVDGISGVGAMECRMDAWNIDLLVVGSQKALMMAPGLAMLGVSTNAKAAIESLEQAPSYYFNLKEALKSAKTNETPYTPAHTLIAALNKSLQRIEEEGIENVWKRHQAMSDAMTSAVQALGLEILPDRPSTALTVFRSADGVSSSDWLKLLETKYGIKAADGQNELKGKILRIAHLGYMDPMDILSIVGAIEWSMQDMGIPVTIGTGLQAAAKSFANYYTA